MTEPILDREAHRLLLSIGVQMELWILDDARARAEARAAAEDSAACIAASDIREAADAFLEGGVDEFRSVLDERLSRTHSTVAAG